MCTELKAEGVNVKKKQIRSGVEKGKKRKGG